jgi:hypothetical protein
MVGVGPIGVFQALDGAYGRCPEQAVSALVDVVTEADAVADADAAAEYVVVPITRAARPASATAAGRALGVLITIMVSS